MTVGAVWATNALIPKINETISKNNISYNNANNANKKNIISVTKKIQNDIEQNLDKNLKDIYETVKDKGKLLDKWNELSKKIVYSKEVEISKTTDKDINENEYYLASVVNDTKLFWKIPIGKNTTISVLVASQYKKNKIWTNSNGKEKFGGEKLQPYNALVLFSIFTDFIENFNLFDIYTKIQINAKDVADRGALILNLLATNPHLKTWTVIGHDAHNGNWQFSHYHVQRYLEPNTNANPNSYKIKHKKNAHILYGSFKNVKKG
ncbi:hypothetical protein [[Mycoplasma] collis]|uniref:hypothetical protein n=1 Tax=[Mycoplasma] collis TaxID=2127 RepID=UPI00051C8BA7|nr:hypothetical protein [[Mycoplasma] collis]